MSAKNALAALRERLKDTKTNNSGGQNNYFPFWNMQVGEQAIVRFLPDANGENPFLFFVEKHMHTLPLNGEKKSVPCLKMYDEKCPICKVSSDFYNKDDKENGKTFYRKRQYLAQVLVIKDPLPGDKETSETHEGKVRYLAMGNKLYETILDAIQSGELEDVPYSYQTGTNFIIKKTQQGQYANYDRSKFDPKGPSELDDDTIAHVEAAVIDLSTLLPKKPDVEEMEAKLQASLTGEHYEEKGKRAPASPSEDDESGSAPAKPVTRPASVVSKPEVSKPAVKPAAPTSESDFDDEDANRILEQIRQRRKTAA